MRRRERGAVLVEAAIVTPLVLVLFFSVIWGAFVFRAYLSAERAAADGSREASIAGNSNAADWYVLEGVEPALAALNKNSLERVIVYEATEFEEAPSAACLAAGTGCNVYTAADLTQPQTMFGPGGWAKDDRFPAGSRSVSLSNTEFVGVYVEVKPFAGNLRLPAPEKLSSFTVLRVEPQSF